MAKRGLFITLEGGEGAGKSTQIKLLANRLEEAGVSHILTREPGGTPGAEAIRDLVVNGDVDRWSPAAELLLFTAARRDHLERVVLPALTDGTCVICDRYIDSTIAYQGIAGGLGADYVMAVSKLALPQGWLPDLTFMLNLPPKAGLARAAVRGEGEARFENKDQAFHDDLVSAFLEIAVADPKRCRVINADQTPDEVATDIWAELSVQLDQR